MKAIRAATAVFVLGAAMAARGDEVSTGSPAPAPTASTVRPAPQKRSNAPKKAKRREQKETEGTEAPGRFEADTILKSSYSIHGQPLEVDPD